MSTGCKRVWQAAAYVDGRLEGNDGAAFGRHAETCRDCSRELQFLERLGSLAASLPEPAASELERRRLRQDILRRADAVITGADSGRSASAWLPAWSAPALLAACALAWWGLRGSATPASPGEVLRASGSATSSPTTNDSPAVVTASAAPTSGPGSVSGSAVSGSAVSGSAVSGSAVSTSAAEPGVATEPAVAARPADVPLGETPRLARAPTADRGQAGSRHRPGAVLSRTEPSPPEPSRSALTAVSGAGGPESSEAGGDASLDAGAQLARAVGAFSRGDYRFAESELRRFETSFPDDARAEDAAFLRAICRQRLGDHQGARHTASEYLRRFPGGFRRQEARAIAVSYE